jgi:hypothetical protein
MNLIDFNEIVEIECSNIENIINEINRVYSNLGENGPNMVEKTALAHYLMSIPI